MPLEQLTVAATQDALVAGLADLSDLTVVGVDVERADWDRYYRAPALIQVGGGGRVLVVDPLALGDLAPLAAFLAARQTVVHALENDLVPLAACGVEPPHVDDTAIAAALLGLPTGLSALLEAQLGITLEGDKQAMQRADWEARPLSEEMLRYAAADVADLPALWQELDRRLEQRSRRGWYDEELATTLAQPAVEERRAWHRVKGVGSLDPPARSRMNALWRAREDLAQRTDTAPNRIVGDKVLVDLAASPPAGVSDLGRRGMRRQSVRQFGDQLVAALDKPTAAPLPDPRRRPTDADRAAADRLRTLRADIAGRLGIDPGVLCPNRVLLAALLSDPGSAEELRAALRLRAWQWEQVGAAFCEALGLASQGRASSDANRRPRSNHG